MLRYLVGRGAGELGQQRGRRVAAVVDLEEIALVAVALAARDGGATDAIAISFEVHRHDVEVDGRLRAAPDPDATIERAAVAVATVLVGLGRGDVVVAEHAARGAEDGRVRLTDVLAVVDEIPVREPALTKRQNGPAGQRTASSGVPKTKPPASDGKQASGVGARCAVMC